MEKRIPIAVVLTLAALTVVPSAIAADPTHNDITIHAKGFPPSCHYPDALIRFTNSSSEWFYQVEVNVEVENDSEGPERCAVECSYERCRCTISGTYDVVPNQDEDDSVSGCQLPPCNNCNPNCDTGNPGNCSTPDHCVCIYGTYLVTHYSLDGDDWTGFAPGFAEAFTIDDLTVSDVCAARATNTSAISCRICRTSSRASIPTGRRS